MKKRFLVISPHPDDAELGLAGTIIKLKEKSHQVFLIDLTSGEPTPYGNEKTREKEAQRAGRILKIDERINLGLTNRYLFDNKEARLLLAEKIRLLKPDILFCPYLEDVHPDHQATTRITEGARFYAKYTKVKLKGEPHYPFYLFYYFCSHLRLFPNFSFLVDISEQFKGKMKAIRCYRSQFVENPKNRFVFEYIEIQNRFLGKLIQVECAEGLYTKEAIKINDLDCLL